LILAKMLPPSNSVALYSEGTFEEHVQELVDYLARGRVDDTRVAYIKPFSDALLPGDDRPPFEESQSRRREVLGLVLREVKGLGDGSDKEVEGFFNLLVSHILENYPTAPEAMPYIQKLISVMKSSPRPIYLKCRILTNIFNVTPQTSPLRLKTYLSIVEIASKSEEYEALQLQSVDFEKWLAEWEVSVEEKASFLKSITTALVSSGHAEKAHPYTLARARILPKDSPVAKEAVLEAVASALQLPSIFNFDSLFKLGNLPLIKDHPLRVLLNIFLGKGLSDYQSWASSHADCMATYSLDRAELERKIRLLTLASLTSTQVGKAVLYAQIASALQVPEQDVEKWVIQGIRVKLLVGKLNQPSKTLVVIRSTTRTFGKPEWEQVAQRLQVWKGALQEVLQVVESTQKKVPAAASQIGGVTA